MKASAFPRPAFLAHHLADALEFLRHVLIGGNDFVESVRNLAFQASPRARQSHGEIPISHYSKAAQDRGEGSDGLSRGNVSITVRHVARGVRGLCHSGLVRFKILILSFHRCYPEPSRVSLGPAAKSLRSANARRA